MNDSISRNTLRCTLDPEIKVFADAVQRDYARLAVPEPTVEHSRNAALTVRERWKQGGPEMARVSDHRVGVGNTEIVVRLFEPAIEPDRPVLVYLHGGGWTLFSLETHDRLMREYAARTGFKVLGVDYSLAPENRFPHQIHEVESVLTWLARTGKSLGIDPQRVAVGGDSAGANLTLAVCLRLRDSGFKPAIRAMVLNYGAFDASEAFSEDETVTDEEFLLTYEEMKGFWRNYLRGPADTLDPLASPIRAELSGLPPVFMAIAECDILLEENQAMAKKLGQAGVHVEPVVYPGATHSFLEAVSIAKIADRALQETSIWLVNAPQLDPVSAV